MEGIFEGDNAGALGVRAGDLHRVLDGFGTSVHEQSLLRKVAGCELVQPLGEPDVRLIRRDLDAGVKEALGLLVDRIDDAGRAMADVDAADAAGEIDEAIAVDILQRRPFGLGNIDWRGVGQSARNSGIAALG